MLRYAAVGTSLAERAINLIVTNHVQCSFLGEIGAALGPGSGSTLIRVKKTMA